ncbi:MAG: GNAT family N-acetyltransferase [Terriglobales bacterium]
MGSDYLDFLIDDACMPAVLDCICGFILGHRSEWDFIELSDTGADSIAVTGFRENMKSSSMTAHVALSSLCPYVRLPENPDSYLAGLSSKLRQNLRYSLRALGRQGDVQFTVVKEPLEVGGAFDDVLRLHRARFAQRDCRSTFLNSEVAAFHRAALKALSAAGRTRLHFLELGGKRVAALYAFSTGRKVFFYQSGLDSEYSRFSVGTLLTSFAIQTAIRTGHAEFDFLRGNEPYKLLWTNSSRQLYTVRFFDRRGRSRIACATHQIATLLRQWKHRLRYAKTGAPSPEPRNIHGNESLT